MLEGSAGRRQIPYQHLLYFPEQKAKGRWWACGVLGSWDSLRRLLGEAVTSCPQVLFNAQS